MSFSEPTAKGSNMETPEYDFLVSPGKSFGGKDVRFNSPFEERSKLSSEQLSKLFCSVEMEQQQI